MSLQARLSILSVGILFVLLLAGGAFQYLALGEYVRRDEAAVLQQRYNQTINKNLELVRGPRCQAVTTPGVAAGSTPSPTPGGAQPSPTPRSNQVPAVINNRVNPPVARCIVGALSGPAVSAVLIDADGRVNAAAPDQQDYPTLALRDYLRGAGGKTQRYYLSGSGAGESLIVLHTLPDHNGRALGVVQLSESAQPLQTTQRRLLYILGIATGALMLLAAIATPVLVRRALRPLRRVTEASAGVATGDFSRRVEEPSTHDELGMLARAFNDMAVAVQRAFGVREESEAAMRHFVGDASHELRTPLTTIQGQLDLLQRGAANDPEAQRASWESMQREVRRMSVLVEDLLTLTRLDSPDDREQVRQPVDIDQLIADAVDEQSVRVPGQMVVVEAQLPGEVVVRGDQDQLRRVLLNIANNALAHAPGGTHRWRSGVEGSDAVFSLSDEGPGIPDDALRRIFDRFYRGDVEHRSNGSGLGLAIVKSIVEAHGGSVEARNDAVGATLTVRIPRTEETKTTPAGAPES